MLSAKKSFFCGFAHDFLGGGQPVVHRQAVKPKNYFLARVGVVFFTLGPRDGNNAAGVANMWWVTMHLHMAPAYLPQSTHTPRHATVSSSSS
jgi:hypothetical protein